MEMKNEHVFFADLAMAKHCVTPQFSTGENVLELNKNSIIQCIEIFSPMSERMLCIILIVAKCLRHSWDKLSAAVATPY